MVSQDVIRGVVVVGVVAVVGVVVFAGPRVVASNVAWGAGTSLLGGALIVAGLLWLFQGNRLRSTEPDRITDATAGGEVMLEGEARPADRTLDAPFTDTEVLAYDYTVEEYTRDPDPDQDDHGPDYSWETEASGERAVPFLLETGGGSVYVEADAADLDVADDGARIEVGSVMEAPEEVRAFLAEEDIDPSGRKQRFEEDRLEVGETTFVSGMATGAHAAGSGVPDDASAVVGPGEADGAGDTLATALVPGAGFYVADAPIAEAGKRLLLRGAAIAGVGLVVGGAGVALALGLL